MIKSTFPLNYDQSKLRKLCEKYSLDLVILHGSRATGKLHQESDIDIAVLVGRKNKIKNHRLDMVGNFSELFGDNCDLVVLNHTESMIAYQAATKGILLYEVKRGLFNAFKTVAITRYQDAAKFRRLEARYLQTAIERTPR